MYLFNFIYITVWKLLKSALNECNEQSAETQNATIPNMALWPQILDDRPVPFETECYQLEAQSVLISFHFHNKTLHKNRQKIDFHDHRTVCVPLSSPSNPGVFCQ